MENGVLTFFATAVTALAVENAVFFRVLGVNKHILFLKSPKSGILYGGVLTGMLMISSLLVDIVNRLLDGRALIAYLRAPAYFVCAAIVFVAMRLLMARYAPGAYEKIRDILPVTAFNTALFGAFYVSAMNAYSFVQTMGYALGGGLGYTVAILIVYYARKRLAMNPVPRSFRGLPILLVYIGLLSLALYGLIGQGLPT